ncbi:MAG: PA2169 family four-helix-bundle protein [Acidimicrobiales bacterium]
MSTDETTATALIRTLENGKEGFAKAAEKLDASDRSDVAAKFREFEQQRSVMSDELKAIAAAYGDDVAQRSTVPGALHRGWMAVKDALSSDDADAVIAAAETGEDHAVEQYREALEADISPEFRPVVARQLASVQAAHDYVRSLKSTS